MGRGAMRQSGFSFFSRALAIAAVALIAACVQAPPPAQTAPPMADRVVVHKSTRTLNLLRDRKVLASFPVALGRDPFGPKQHEGDGKTPEGVYRIDYKSMQSRYTRALHVSYPDDNDRARAQAMNVDPGGAIFVHGLPNEYGPVDAPPWSRDWTEGCISVGNIAIVKIWDAVPEGTPIEITP
jgi:murein L,D-transpeptidase YafK